MPRIKNVSDTESCVVADCEVMADPSCCDEEKKWRGEAKLDTGATLSHFCDGIMIRVEARLVGKQKATGFGGAIFDTKRYAVSISIEGGDAFLIEALSTSRDMNVLGFDIIRKLNLIYNGQVVGW